MRLVALVLIAMTGGSADACPWPLRCPDAQRVIPEDRATNVSPDAKLWIDASVGRGTVRLLGPHEARELGSLPPGADWFPYHRFRFDPGPLEPWTTYTIHVDGYGDLATFTTAGKSRPVTPPGIRRFELADVTYGALPPDHEVDVDLAIPDDAVAVELTLRDDYQQRTLRATPDTWYSIAGSQFCSRRVAPLLGPTACLEVTAIGDDENRSPTTKQCVTRTVRTHDEWFPLKYSHPMPCPPKIFEGDEVIRDSHELEAEVLPWLLAVIAFMLSIGRAAWHTRERQESRVADALVVERAAQHAMAISRLVIVAVAIAIAASLVSGASAYLPCVLGLGLYDVIGYSRARYVARTSRAPGATCAIGGDAVAVDGTWLRVGRRAIESPAIPAARAVNRRR